MTVYLDHLGRTADLTTLLGEGKEGKVSLCAAPGVAVKVLAPGSVVARTLPFSYYPGADGKLPDTLFVAYGIERYYVPEGEGRLLEQARNAQALEIAARVGSDGTMQIRQIFVNGKPAYQEPLY